MRADICICTACKDMLIEKCLESIDRYVDKSKIGDICICCTTDEALQKTLPLLKKYTEKQAFSIKLTQQEYNYAKCNNALTKMCSSECILLLNDDVELLEDSLTPCLEAIKDNGVGTVGTMLVYPSNLIQHAGVFCEWQNNGNAKEFYRVGHIGLMQRQQYPDMLNFGNTAAFLLVRRSDFEAVGGFNENYKHCFEDVELNAKISVLRGCPNLTLNSHRAIHRESSTRHQAHCMSDLQMLADYCNAHCKELSSMVVGVQYHKPEGV